MNGDKKDVWYFHISPPEGHGLKKRIWELDVLRGGNLFLMMAIHFVYDITCLFPLVRWDFPQWYDAVISFCGTLFVALSGICVTFGKHPVRRGLTVLGGGLLCTAVTTVLALTGLCHKSIIIYFGVLHCLGCCMLLWPLFRRCPGWLRMVLGIGLIVLGRYLSTLQGNTVWLIPFGVTTADFQSSDYFPLVRHLGTFLCGAGVARYLYPEGTSLLPNVNQNNPILRFLGWCGRKSLWIYLLHQPVLAALAAVLYYT